MKHGPEAIYGTALNTGRLCMEVASGAATCAPAQLSTSAGQPVSWALTPDLKKEPITIITILERRKARSNSQQNGRESVTSRCVGTRAASVHRLVSPVTRAALAPQKT